MQTKTLTAALYPHQKEAIDFALSQKRCYLALSPGLGKTIVAASLSKNLRAFTVFITPPSLIENVSAEYEKWYFGARIGVYGERLLNYPALDVLIIPDSKLSMITHYFLRGVLGVIQKETLLIIDEAHRFTSEMAQRSRVLLGTRRGEGILPLFDRHVYLSGTPLSNRPMELWPILDRSAPETIAFMNRFQYGRRYCDGKKVQIAWKPRPKFAWDFKGQSNLRELAQRILYPSGDFMLRQRKDRIDLPPRIEEIFLFSRAMSPRLSGMDKEIGEAYEDIDDLVKAEIGGQIGERASRLHIATYRRLLGSEKARAAAEYIDLLLTETDETILCFAFHLETIEQLAALLKKHQPLTITGAVKASRRHEAVQSFQKGKGRLVIGNYKAMGVGFTLTKASRVIFVEFSWNPADNEQAIDRAHRIGQTKTVYAQYMVYKDSIDKKVIEALLKKREASRHI